MVRSKLPAPFFCPVKHPTPQLAVMASKAAAGKPAAAAVPAATAKTGVKAAATASAVDDFSDFHKTHDTLVGLGLGCGWCVWVGLWTRC